LDVAGGVTPKIGLADHWPKQATAGPKGDKGADALF
jgi:hypothetical protein